MVIADAEANGTNRGHLHRLDNALPFLQMCDREFVELLDGIRAALQNVLYCAPSKAAQKQPGAIATAHELLAKMDARIEAYRREGK